MARKRGDDTLHASPQFYLAFLGLGLGSWVMSDFVFAEIAALVQKTPEGASIGVYVIVALQSANVFPMLYMLFNSEQQRLSIPTTIWALLGLVLLSATWDLTSSPFGHPVSSALLFFVFCGGIVSATSSVVFYPFVSAYPATATSALATGESLSAVIAGFLAIAQNVGSSTINFSISSYFACASTVFVVSMLSFIYLRRHIPKSASEEDEKAWLLETSPALTCQQEMQVLRIIWKPLACQCALAMFSFAVVPSVLPILSSKYKNSGTVLKWASVLGMLLDPLARFMTSFYRARHVGLLTVLALLAGTCMALQASARVPWWSLDSMGGIFELDIENVKAAYQWSGFVTQMGALTGTAATFGLATLTSVFST
ncbi:hypothetical protein ACHHYP_20718 [Achlya hypogyna]|uniref:Equilibrative Nucleoside Transporter (ENT) Family n=1 Tax=Achlya hypogyna TaxID=1202772 RepID=A0A1V9YDN2_ACHHY|nr:hypothetical protein ACHHYP_20718 [Achlya hypogyna]